MCRSILHGLFGVFIMIIVSANFINLTYQGHVNKKIKMVVGQVFRHEVKTNRIGYCTIHKILVLDAGSEGRELPSWVHYDEERRTLLGLPPTKSVTLFSILLFGGSIGQYVGLCDSYTVEVEVFGNETSLSYIIGHYLYVSAVPGTSAWEGDMQVIETIRSCDRSARGFILTLVLASEHELSSFQQISVSLKLTERLRIASALQQVLPHGHAGYMTSQLSSIYVHGANSYSFSTKHAVLYSFSWLLGCSLLQGYRQHLFHRGLVPDIEAESGLRVSSWHLASGLLSRHRRDVFFGSVTALVGTPVVTQSPYRSLVVWSALSSDASKTADVADVSLTTSVLFDNTVYSSAGASFIHPCKSATFANDSIISVTLATTSLRLSFTSLDRPPSCTRCSVGMETTSSLMITPDLESLSPSSLHSSFISASIAPPHTATSFWQPELTTWTQNSILGSPSFCDNSFSLISPSFTSKFITVAVSPTSTRPGESLHIFATFSLATSLIGAASSVMVLTHSITNSLHSISYSLHSLPLSLPEEISVGSLSFIQMSSTRYVHAVESDSKSSFKVSSSGSFLLESPSFLVSKALSKTSTAQSFVYFTSILSDSLYPSIYMHFSGSGYLTLWESMPSKQSFLTSVIDSIRSLVMLSTESFSCWSSCSLTASAISGQSTSEFTMSEFFDSWTPLSTLHSIANTTYSPSVLLSTGLSAAASAYSAAQSSSWSGTQSPFPTIQFPFSSFAEARTKDLATLESIFSTQLHAMSATSSGDIKKSEPVSFITSLSAASGKIETDSGWKNTLFLLSQSTYPNTYFPPLSSAEGASPLSTSSSEIFTEHSLFPKNLPFTSSLITAQSFVAGSPMAGMVSTSASLTILFDQSTSMPFKAYTLDSSLSFFTGSCLFETERLQTSLSRAFPSNSSKFNGDFATSLILSSVKTSAFATPMSAKVQSLWFTDLSVESSGYVSSMNFQVTIRSLATIVSSQYVVLSEGSTVFLKSTPAPDEELRTANLNSMSSENMYNIISIFSTSNHLASSKKSLTSLLQPSIPDFTPTSVLSFASSNFASLVSTTPNSSPLMSLLLSDSASSGYFSSMSIRIAISSKTLGFAMSATVGPTASSSYSTRMLIASPNYDSVFGSSFVSGSSHKTLSAKTLSTLPTASDATRPTSTLKPDAGPVLLNSIGTLSVEVGRLFLYEVPEHTFYDQEDGLTRNLTVRCVDVDGREFKSTWLTYNHLTQSFVGLPLLSDIEVPGKASVEIVLVASDLSGNYAVDVFYIYLTRFSNQINFWLSATFALDYADFFQSKQQQVALVKRVSEFHGDFSYQSLVICNVSSGSVVFTWSNVSMSGPLCNKNLISEVVSATVDPSGRPHPKFMAYMAPEYRVVSISWSFVGACSVAPTVPTSGLQAKSTVSKAFLNHVLPVIVVLFFALVAATVSIFLWRRKQSRVLVYNGKPYAKGRPVLLPDEFELKSCPEEKSYKLPCSFVAPFEGDVLVQRTARPTAFPQTAHSYEGPYVNDEDSSSSPSVSDTDSSDFSYRRQSAWRSGRSDPPSPPPPYVLPPRYTQPFLRTSGRLGSEFL